MPTSGPTLVLAILLASGTAAGAATSMEKRTAVIATRYLQVWSFNGAASVRSVPHLYERTVTFYRQTYTHRQLMAEKREDEADGADDLFDRITRQHGLG